MAKDSFIQLIQISLGVRDAFDNALSDIEWEALLTEAKNQSLLGVLNEGLQRLPQDQRPARLMYLRWAAVADKIETKNPQHSRRTAELAKIFTDAGFQNCILKGQGAASRYPKPDLRQCGDIDIWVPGDRKKVVDFVWSRCPKDVIVYHHVKAQFFKDVLTEVHFTPTWMNNPFHNRRLQAYFAEQAPIQCANNSGDTGFNVTTAEFDAVYMLAHIYRHLFSEGVGLRQLMDYYWTLNAMTLETRDSVSKLLGPLGLQRIAGSVMYVLGRVFALPEEMMLVAPDRRNGEFLLKEMMLSGNFGKSDIRVKNLGTGNGIQRFIKNFSFQLRLLNHYPSEVLWAPFFKLWHYLWRRINGYC